MNSDKNTDGKYAMQCGNSETLYAQQVKKWFQELRIGGGGVIAPPFRREPVS